MADACLSLLLLSASSALLILILVLVLQVLILLSDPCSVLILIVWLLSRLLDDSMLIVLNSVLILFDSATSARDFFCGTILWSTNIFNCSVKISRLAAKCCGIIKSLPWGVLFIISVTVIKIVNV